ncbi:MAG: DUF4351 domain-containing protein, partial [Cyanobacteriota bacterium]|nr:DUF4351 domain-containing protein [Cyanobacteriota bacterium]
PDSFASWLLGREVRGTKVLKTELTMGVLMAEEVTFLRLADSILHLEFKLDVPLKKPVAQRMLNYWMQLSWQYNLPIAQVLIWLEPTNNQTVFETELKMESVRHSFQVVRMWEQSPEKLLESPALLPMALLCDAKNPTALLSQTIARIAAIKESREQQEIYCSAQLLAGLRFDVDFVRNFFPRGIFRQSVIFQDVLQDEILTLLRRQLSRRIGIVAPQLQQRLLQLSHRQLGDLAEALLDFSQPEDLIAWLDKLPEGS